MTHYDPESGRAPNYDTTVRAMVLFHELYAEAQDAGELPRNENGAPQWDHIWQEAWKLATEGH